MDSTDAFSGYFLLIILSPLLTLMINLLFCRNNLFVGSKVTSCGIWISFVNAGLAWFSGLPFSENKASLGFLVNEVTWLMATLILFISSIVHHFSIRYMAGDRIYRRYFLLLSLVTVSTLLLVASDNIVILISFWLLSNLLLVLLMMHKFQWAAAKNASVLAIKTFSIGLVCLIVGIGLLVYDAGTLSLQVISNDSENLSASIRILALFFISIAAFSQSGGWPFHSWLLSSLNSPTPVSAIMHAGLVNGGGFLLVRFAPIFFQESFILDLLFILAVVTLILGGIWKLIQSDIKRMLACSTMTQMGFMMMQCGLGLFPAALAHLSWHSLFKAFLFLKSGSSLMDLRGKNEERVCSIPTFFLSSLCGLIGCIGFILGSDLSFNLWETTSVLIFFSWMAFTQLAYTLLQKKQSFLFVMTAGVFCLATGIIYGLTVDLIEGVVAPMQISQPRLLNFIHLMGVIFVFCIWIGLNFKPFSNHEGSLWWRRFYVTMVNASQPHQKTITSSRNEYQC